MKVSLIIIVKNAEKTIAKCLKSILNQTYSPYETIVVDGQSTDRTREIVSQFPVKIVMAPAKHTYGSSRNLGVDAAKGDIIAFLDADDYADEKWLQNIVEAFDSNNVGIANSKRFFIYPNNWFTDFKWNKMREKKQSNILDYKESKWKEFSTSGGAFRKELIIKAGYFDEDMFFNTEDKELAIRIINMGYEFKTVPKSIIYFKPASSMMEWLKDGFYRHGLGHGTIRRRYRKYHPPLTTPSITTVTAFCFLFFLIFRLWQLIPFLLLLSVLGISIKSYRLYRKTMRLFHSFIYVICEILERNLEFLGFIIGYTISPKILRRIARR